MHLPVKQRIKQQNTTFTSNVVCLTEGGNKDEDTVAIRPLLSVSRNLSQMIDYFPDDKLFLTGMDMENHQNL